jgi:hypothetical protein
MSRLALTLAMAELESQSSPREVPVPCMFLSHQAPVLPLKRLRPRLFSGLGLCLGTLVPDLEFILRLDNDWLVSHTLAAQSYLTVPAVLALYVLLVALALPYWLPRLPQGPPFHFDELHALRLPRDLGGWIRVAVSGFVGGLTHVLLDAVTHGNHSGWLVPYFPLLRASVSWAGDRPLYDLLQIVFNLWFGLGAWLSWQCIARRRLLWCWRGETPRPSVPREPAHRGRAVRVLAACAALGSLVGHHLRPGASAAEALEMTAFGAIAFGFYAFLALPAADRLQRAGVRALALRPPAAPDEA